MDLLFVPENEELLRAIPELKDALRVNVELASPGDLIPLPGGWEERSPFAAREELVTFRHFDLYSQALAKLERAHTQDLADVAAMLSRDLVDRDRLSELYDEIAPSLYRFPAVDPPRVSREPRRRAPLSYFVPPISSTR